MTAAGAVAASSPSWCPSTATQTAAVFGCGPNPMLAALAADPARACPGPRCRAEVSLEAPMGCGFGTCLGCALPLAGGHGTVWGLCCRQGPVMEVSQVDWPGLLALPPAHVA